MATDRKSYADKKVLLGAVLGVSFTWKDTKQETIYNLADLVPAETLAALPEMAKRLMVHGEAQKLGDLSSKAEVTSPADMRAACDELWSALKAGDWNVAAKPTAKMTPAERIAMLEKMLARAKEAEKAAGEVPSV